MATLAVAMGGLAHGRTRPAVARSARTVGTASPARTGSCSPARPPRQRRRVNLWAACAWCGRKKRLTPPRARSTLVGHIPRQRERAVADAAGAQQVCASAARAHTATRVAVTCSAGEPPGPPRGARGGRLAAGGAGAPGAEEKSRYDHGRRSEQCGADGRPDRPASSAPRLPVERPDGQSPPGGA